MISCDNEDSACAGQELCSKHVWEMSERENTAGRHWNGADRAVADPWIYPLSIYPFKPHIRVGMESHPKALKGGAEVVPALSWGFQCSWRGCGRGK